MTFIDYQFISFPSHQNTIKQKTETNTFNEKQKNKNNKIQPKK